MLIIIPLGVVNTFFPSCQFTQCEKINPLTYWSNSLPHKIDSFKLRQFVLIYNFHRAIHNFVFLFNTLPENTLQCQLNLQV